MIKPECIGIPDMILLLMKDKSKHSTEPRKGSILIWGCISRNGRSQLNINETDVHLNGEIYERLLRERPQNEMLQHQTDICMDYNAPCHRASRVSRFFREENIQLMDWSGNSPEISPIENAWFIL